MAVKVEAHGNSTFDLTVPNCLKSDPSFRFGTKQFLTPPLLALENMKNLEENPKFILKKL